MQVLLPLWHPCYSPLVFKHSVLWGYSINGLHENTCHEGMSGILFNSSCIRILKLLMKSLTHCVRIVVPYRHSEFHTLTLYKSCSDYFVHSEKLISIYTCTRLVFWCLGVLHTTGKMMLNTWRYTILKWQDFQRNTRQFTNILQVVASAFRLAKKTLLVEYLLPKLLKKPSRNIPQTAGGTKGFSTKPCAVN